MIKARRIIFPKKLFEGLIEFLSSKEPSETGCFLLAHHYTTRDAGIVLTVVDVIKPSSDSWNYENEHGLEPTSSFINQSVLKADASNSSLIFVHTHPDALHPARFSPIDEETNGKLLANLSEILRNRPLGSIVFSRRGMYGVILDEGKMAEITDVRIAGTTYYEFPVTNDGRKIQAISSTFDRQVRAIGMGAQSRLQETIVSVVGVGGTGSAVAVQLARMGVKKLRLIDRDVVDESNMARVYGSTFKGVGKPKVKVLKKHISSFSKTKVETLSADIAKKEVVSILADSDVIFGCTDNLMSRSILNDVAVQYYIPLIDVGCRVDLNQNRSINQSIAKVHVVTPDNACLWCTGALDGKAILQESFSDEEKRKLANEGYYEGVEKQPSIVSLTTLAASIAVNKFLSLINVFGDEYYSRTQVEVKEEFMVSDSPEIRADCICRKRRGLGDCRRIVFGYKPKEE